MTSCKILTEDRWQRFLKNQLAKDEEQEIVAHLSTDCPHCILFFSELEKSKDSEIRSEFNKLVGKDSLTVTCLPEVDRPLLSGVAGQAVSGQRSFWQRLFGFSGDHSSMPAWAGSLAVVFVVGLIMVPQLKDVDGQAQYVEAASQKMKGSHAMGSQLKLKFATGSRDADQQLLVREGVTGSQYSNNDLLFLNYDLARDGYVYLLGFRDGGKVELLYPDATQNDSMRTAGSHNVPADDQIKGISLSGIQGRYAVIGVFAEQPVDVNEVLIPTIKKSIDPLSGLIDLDTSTFQERIAIDLVYFDVQA